MGSNFSVFLAFFFFISQASGATAAQYTISTFAGTGRTDFSGDNGPAAVANLYTPTSVAVDQAGNVFIADLDHGRIRKVDSSGTITTVAGGGTRGPDNGVPAISASISPSVLAADNAGNLYFARPTVFKIDASGVLKTLANTGINFTGGLVVDGSGNIYISDSYNQHWVLKISPSGVVTTIAGTGTGGYSGDNGPAINAQLNAPGGLALDSAGNLYIADFYNNRIRKVDTAGIITTVAGSGKPDYLGDGGSAMIASFNGPVGVALDSAGNMFIADRGNNVVRRVDTSGVVTTVAGNGRSGVSGDGGAALNAAMGRPAAIAVDSAGRIYVADPDNQRVRVLMPVQAAPSTVISLSPTSVPVGGAAFTLTVNGNGFASGAVAQWNGNPLPTTVVNSTLLSVSVPASVVSQAGVAGVSVTNSGAARSNIVSFTITPVPRAITPINYTISTFAGTGRTDFSGDNGRATAANLYTPTSVAVDQAGNVFIADLDHGRIRKVDSSGTITTVAGGGTRSPDNGVPAISASISPSVLAADNAGNLYFARPTVFQIDASGVLKTLANTGINFTGGLVVDGSGNIYISDSYNQHWVLKISPSGVVTTIAGTGTGGYSGDNGPAINAQLNAPGGLALDSAGNLYIADFYNNRIRKVDTAGIITTVAGSGKPDYLGDGGSAMIAAFNGPVGVALDSAGNMFIADRGNNVVRRVDTSGVVTTVAGNGRSGESGDGGAALNAAMGRPAAIAIDANGRIFIADPDNERVRLLTPQQTGPGPANLTSLSPSSATAIGPAFTLTVNGSGFVTGASVRWNTISLATSFVSSTQLTAAVPASLIAAAGSASITVVNPGAAPSNSQTFAIRAQTPPPTGCSPTGLLIQAVSPQSGFSATIGQPLGIQVVIADNCGVPVLTGKGSTVIATFSNADPSIVLAGAGSGKWAATWTPATGQGPVIVEIDAFEALTNGIILGGRVDISGIIQRSGPTSLAISPDSLTFSLSQGGQPASQPLTVVNQGSQAANFTATASTTWLSVSPQGGTSSPGQPGILTVTATPSNLTPGTYTGSVAVQSGGSILPPVPVTMTVSPAQSILLLSQSGLGFRAAQSGGAPLPQDFGILNIGQGVMSWTAQASTLSGPNWLSISPASGSVNRPYLDISAVTVSVDPSGLSAGTYYGRIQVTANGAGNSPQSISVVLNILPQGTNPGPEVRPTGLIFAGPQSPNPSSQGFMIGNSATNPVNFGSAPVTIAGVPTWFSYSMGATSLQPGKPLPIDVQPDFARLAPGATKGSIALLFDDGTSASVSLLAVIPPSAATPSQSDRSAPDGATSSGSDALPAANGCAPAQLNIQSSGPQINAPLGQPVTLEVRIVDNCAQPLTNSTPGSAVRASFSNGDPSSAMVHVGNGRWTVTWQPQRTNSSGTYVATVTAFEALSNGGAFGNQVDIPVTLTARGDVPIVSSGAIFNAASFTSNAPVAPGGLITIFGSKLADGPPLQAGQLPLPSQLSGTKVFLGNTSLPLLYASDGQINAQVPYDIAINVPNQLVVQRGNAISVPQIVSVAPAQPAIFTKDQSGHGQGVIVNASTNQFVDSAAPVTAGDTVVIYCTGLGAVNPPTPPGTGATGPTPTVQPVTVTIGDHPAQVTFAGLTGEFAGVYQVNTVVPGGITPGSSVPVVISTAGQSSPAVTIAVR